MKPFGGAYKCYYLPSSERTPLKTLQTLVSLFKSKTSNQGIEIVKSGVASLSIAGLISTGKLSASGIDGTLLIILSIPETFGYLYGMVAISSGSAQLNGIDQLPEGKGESLQKQEAKTLFEKAQDTLRLHD